MKILNLGSLNLDKVYSVDRFVQPGQTIMASNYEVFSGGKGLNQSVAIACAGAQVYHLGMAGLDGSILRNLLKNSGVNLKYLFCADCDSGHAIIQVEPAGQNCIIINGGANQGIEEKHIDEALSDFSAGDTFLTQNETSCVSYAIKAAHDKGIKVAFNPSPITPELMNYPLELVDIFILNEIEGAELSGCKGSYDEILNALSLRFPNAEFVFTVGKDGAYYKKSNEVYFQPSYNVETVDTTAAGDTFCGYFLASMIKGFGPREALVYASCAAAISVGRSGAAPSIPTWDETMERL